MHATILLRPEWQRRLNATHAAPRQTPRGIAKLLDIDVEVLVAHNTNRYPGITANSKLRRDTRYRLAKTSRAREHCIVPAPEHANPRNTSKTTLYVMQLQHISAMSTSRNAKSDTSCVCSLVIPGSDGTTATSVLLDNNRLTAAALVREIQSAVTDANQNACSVQHHVGYYDHTAGTDKNTIKFMPADVLPLPPPHAQIVAPSAELTVMQDASTDASIPEFGGDHTENLSARIDFCTLAGFSTDETPARCMYCLIYEPLRMHGDVM